MPVLNEFLEDVLDQFREPPADVSERPEELIRWADESLDIQKREK